MDSLGDERNAESFCVSPAAKERRSLSGSVSIQTSEEPPPLSAAVAAHLFPANATAALAAAAAPALSAVFREAQNAPLKERLLQTQTHQHPHPHHHHQLPIQQQQQQQQALALVPPRDVASSVAAETVCYASVSAEAAESSGCTSEQTPFLPPTQTGSGRSGHASRTLASVKFSQGSGAWAARWVDSQGRHKYKYYRAKDYGFEEVTTRREPLTDTHCP